MEIEKVIPATVEFRESPFFYDDPYEPYPFTNFIEDMEYALIGHGAESVDKEVIEGWFQHEAMYALKKFIRELERA